MANVWDVYTVGDVSFIHEVFLGVSHIFYGTGHNVFLQVYMIGMLLGFIWIFIESMIQQKPIALGRFLVAFIIYSALFVPRATVHLEDSQTKKFYTMDNIPLGLAVGSSLVSKVGAGLTHVFEDYFTPIGGAGSGCSPSQMTCSGYLGTLNKIIQARNNLSSKPAFMALDRAICGFDYKAPALPTDGQIECSMEKSISNYVKDCAINKFLQKPQLLKKIRGFNDLRYPNASLNTEIYLYNDGGKTKDCLTAYNEISATFTKYQSVLADLSLNSEYISNTSHSHVGGGDDTDRTISGAGINQNQIAEILAMMSGTSGTTPDAYSYIKNVMLRGPMEAGLEQGFSESGNNKVAEMVLNGTIGEEEANAYLMIKSARDQRNIQWAAEENMWISTAKAMATFFEGFVVALVVLLPFMMFLGSLSIMIEYLKVLMWVQLWNPVMAICNLYIQTAASKQVKDAIANAPITDIYVMDSVDEVVQHWIAVGGLMAATTPLLALFILKGSVYTFTTLASRMSGGDHVNEKAVSPDVMQHAPFLQNTMGAYTGEYGKGLFATNSDFAYAQLSLSQLASDQVTSSKTKMTKSQENFMESAMHAVSQQKSEKFADNYNREWSKALEAKNKLAKEIIFKEAQIIADELGLGHDMSFVRSIAKTLSISKKDEKDLTPDKLKEWLKKATDDHVKVKLQRYKKFSVDGSNAESEKFRASMSKALKNIKERTGEISDSESLDSANAYAHKKALDSTFSMATNQDAVSSATSAYSRMLSDEKSYNQASAMKRSIDVSYRMDSRQLASMIDDGEWEKWVQSLSVYDRDEMGVEDPNRWGKKTGTDFQKGKTTALEYLLGSGHKSDLAQRFREKFGDRILSALPGISTINPGDAVNTEYLKDANPSPAAVRKQRNAIETEAARIEADLQEYEKKGNVVADDVKDELRRAQEEQEKKVNDKREKMKAKQDEGRIEDAEKLGKEVDSGKTEEDADKSVVWIDGVGKDDYGTFIETLPLVFKGKDLQNEEFAEFVIISAEWSKGFFFSQVTENGVLKLQEEVRKFHNLSKHPEQQENAAKHKDALAAAARHEDYLTKPMELRKYQALKERAVQKMIHGGIPEAQAWKIADQFDVISNPERAHAMIGAMLFDYAKVSRNNRNAEGNANQILKRQFTKEYMRDGDMYDMTHKNTGVTNDDLLTELLTYGRATGKPGLINYVRGIINYGYNSKGFKSLEHMQAELKKTRYTMKK